MSPPARQLPLCREPGCDRVRPMRNNVSCHADSYCTLHDGITYAAPICLCKRAIADSVRQCTRCWKPIASLHRLLADSIDIYPELADQTIEPDGMGEWP